LSGLVTEAGPGWHESQLVPYVEHIVGAFGAQRLMWGSDWPVVNLASDYPGWFAVAGRLVAELSVAERDLIFGGTAATFYGIASTERTA
jgi:L-fuconolactonase